jgi:hypothetical protein
VFTRERQAAARPIMNGSAVVALVHGAVCLGTAQALRLLGLEVRTFRSLEMLQEFGSSSVRHPELLLWSAWADWLWAFAPLSFAAAGAALVAGTRLLGSVVAAGAVPYVVVTWLLLGPATERGAYLLPVAWPAAVLAARALPRASLVLVALAGLVLGVLAVRAHDDASVPRRYAAMVRSVCGDERPFLIVGSLKELGMFQVQLPQAQCKDLFQEVLLTPQEFAAGLPMFDAYLRDRLREGHALILTGGARALLMGPRGTNPQTGRALLAYFEQAWRSEPCATNGLALERLRPR